MVFFLTETAITKDTAEVAHCICSIHHLSPSLPPFLRTLLCRCNNNKVTKTKIKNLSFPFPALVLDFLIVILRHCSHQKQASLFSIAWLLGNRSFFLSHPLLFLNCICKFCFSVVFGFLSWLDCVFVCLFELGFHGGQSERSGFFCCFCYSTLCFYSSACYIVWVCLGFLSGFLVFIKFGFVTQLLFLFWWSTLCLQFISMSYHVIIC